MRLLFLTSLTMIAFAANSVLTRTALESDDIGALSFASIRISAGALVLLVLISARRDVHLIGKAFDPAAALGLLVYMLGFSVSYINLEAGIGALILFGGVQITMFLGAVLSDKKPLFFEWLGAAVAFSGIIILLLPSGGAPSLVGIVCMIFAAVGWGVYSMRGAKAQSPLAATCANFSAALPVVALAWLLMDMGRVGSKGALLALISGGVTSALGYALWYLVLPKLQTATAAVAQLTVPVIAASGGVIFLSEPLTVIFSVSSALVLGGVGISVWAISRS